MLYEKIDGWKSTIKIEFVEHIPMTCDHDIVSLKMIILEDDQWMLWFDVSDKFIKSNLVLSLMHNLDETVREKRGSYSQTGTLPNKPQFSVNMCKVLESHNLARK